MNRKIKIVFILILIGCGFIIWNRNVTSLQQKEVKEKEKIQLSLIAPYESLAFQRALEDLVTDYCGQIGNSNIEIKVEYLPQERYKKELNMRMENSELADIIISENTVMPALVDMGIYRDISYYVQKEKRKGDFYNALWKSTQNNGKYYGLPFTCDPYALFYNEEELQKNNQPVPKDWNQLLKVCSKIDRLGVNSLGLALAEPEETTNLFLQLLYSTGGSIRSINDDNGIRTLYLIDTLTKHDLIAKECITWNEIDVIKAFENREISMMINRLSSVSTLKTDRVPFKIGASIVPYEKKETYLFHGDNIGISKDADYQNSLKFITYLSSRSVVEKYAKLTNTIPVRRELNYKSTTKLFNISNEIVDKQIVQGISKDAFNLWFDISDAISSGMYELAGVRDKSSKEIADEMQDKVRMAIIND